MCAEDALLFTLAQRPSGEWAQSCRAGHICLTLQKTCKIKPQDSPHFQKQGSYTHFTVLDMHAACVVAGNVTQEPLFRRSSLSLRPCSLDTSLGPRFPPQLLWPGLLSLRSHVCPHVLVPAPLSVSLSWDSVSGFIQQRILFSSTPFLLTSDEE